MFLSSYIKTFLFRKHKFINFSIDDLIIDENKDIQYLYKPKLKEILKDKRLKILLKRTYYVYKSHI